MKEILKRWYVGLIIVPTIINYLTSYISLPDILEDWKTTIIISEFIVILIFAYELRLMGKRRPTKEPTIKPSDKAIVKDLIDTLDINLFQKEIYEVDSWYGYRRDAIRRVIEFSEKVNLISYKTTDEKLNELINGFNDSLESFTKFSSKELYGMDKDWYIPDKGSEVGLKKIEEARPVMNQMTTDSFERLKTLMKYLKDKEYV
jgi:hypothetical protein